MEVIMKKDKKLYMIGNAHIDPVWLWRWQEGFQEVKATFRSALDRMKEYEEFVFTGSSAAPSSTRRTCWRSSAAGPGTP